MLYLPGTTLGYGEGAPPAPGTSTFVDRMRTDFASIIGDFEESLTIKRLAATYDSLGRLDASAIWLSITTVNGDWQPISGQTILEEQGLDIKSDAKVLVPYNTNVCEGDRVYRNALATFEYVNYVKKYASHLTVFLTKTRNS